MRAALAIMLVAATVPLSATEVLLKNTWITKHKNRATTDVKFTVEKAHKHPNPVGEKSEDGDMHIAGRSPQVGLPMVIEIVNAALPALSTVLTSVKSSAASTATVDLSGVWRFWFEHPGKKAQEQFEPVDPPKNTNPDHVFEIHPVTKWTTDTLDESFVPVAGFTAHDPKIAFGRYEKMVVTVNKGPAFTSFEAKTIGFNYTEFVIVLTSTATQVADGFMALATVHALDGTPIVTQARRMVFVAGTKPAQLVDGAAKGSKFRALGIPRLNLERLMKKASESPGESVDVTGGYEMIVVGMVKS